MCFVLTQFRLFLSFQSIAIYLQEVNKMLSYQPQCWGRDFGLSMDMACHKHPHWAAASSSREPSAPNRIDMSKRFVLIQDQSWLVVHSRSRSMRSCWLRRWRRLHCWARPRSSQRSERSAKVIRDSRRLVEFHRSGWATVDSSPIMATGHLRMLLLVQLSPIVQQEAESEKKEINKILFSLFCLHRAFEINVQQLKSLPF